MSSLIQERKHLKKFRKATMYAIVMWLLFQVVDAVRPNFNASQWIMLEAILVYFLCLPIVMVSLLSSIEDFLAYGTSQ